MPDLEKNRPRRPGLMVIGMLFLTIGILLNRYVEATSVVDFLEGMCYGISIATNLSYFIVNRRKKSTNSH
jgi:hypothetical protein